MRGVKSQMFDERVVSMSGILWFLVRQFFAGDQRVRIAFQKIGQRLQRFGRLGQLAKCFGGFFAQAALRADKFLNALRRVMEGMKRLARVQR